MLSCFFVTYISCTEKKQMVKLFRQISKVNLTLHQGEMNNMKKLTKQEKHDQCMREIKATLLVVAVCCIWHIATAFVLNGAGLYFLGMPAWFSVSVLGTIVLALIGVRILLKKVFIDFEYDDEEVA